MPLEIKNEYGNNVYFVACIKVDEARVLRRVLPASEMATLLTHINLPEHFGVKAEHIEKINVVRAFMHGNWKENEMYAKNLFTLAPSDISVRDLEIDPETAIIVQGIAFDKFFTDCFFVSSIDIANIYLEDICNSAILLKTLHCDIIETIYLTEQ